MSNFNQRFSEIFARREVVEKLSENFSEQEQHESEERLVGNTIRRINVSRRNDRET